MQPGYMVGLCFHFVLPLCNYLYDVVTENHEAGSLTWKNLISSINISIRVFLVMNDVTEGFIVYS